MGLHKIPKNERGMKSSMTELEKVDNEKTASFVGQIMVLIVSPSISANNGPAG
jgi:hypothetical protein